VKTAELERIECEELREKLLSTFAIHMNTKDSTHRMQRISRKKTRENQMTERFQRKSEAQNSHNSFSRNNVKTFGVSVQ
jgi:hypothetical protein